MYEQLKKCYQEALNAGTYAHLEATGQGKELSLSEWEEIVIGKLLENGVTIPVRCKDCKHLEITGCYGECNRGYMGIVKPWDFCSYGERKDNGT